MPSVQNLFNYITTKFMNRKFYQTPTLEVELFRAEQGFALCVENGFGGPTYGEEDVDW